MVFHYEGLAFTFTLPARLNHARCDNRCVVELQRMKKYILVNIWLLLFSGGGYANQSYSTLAAGSLPQYDLSIRIIPDAHRLEVSGTMRLPATNSARDSIELSLSELMTDLRVDVVGPASVAGSAVTEKVTVRPYSRPGWGTATWRVHLPRPINPHVPALLRISYLVRLSG